MPGFCSEDNLWKAEVCERRENSKTLVVVTGLSM